MRFYGIDVSELGGHNPPTVQEILTLPIRSQKWTLEQLTTWVYDHSGDRDELVTTAGGNVWAADVISKKWSELATRTLPNFTSNGAQIIWVPKEIVFQMSMIAARMHRYGLSPDAFTMGAAQATPKSRFSYDTVGESVFVILDR